MKTLKTLLISLLIPFTFSCIDDFCMSGTGSKIVKQYELAAFHSVNYSGSGKVYLTLSSTQEVKIIAQENILDHLDVEVRSGVLYITPERCLDNADIEVYLSAEEFSDLYLNGSGTMKSLNQFSNDEVSVTLTGSGTMDLMLTADKLNSMIIGSGNIELDGTAPETDYQVIGSGKINGYDFATESSVVLVDGSGTVMCNVSKAIKATILGSGAIIYKGNAEVNSKITGSGKVVKGS
jgi:hypothetical protein